MTENATATREKHKVPAGTEIIRYHAVASSLFRECCPGSAAAAATADAEMEWSTETRRSGSERILFLGSCVCLCADVPTCICTDGPGSRFLILVRPPQGPRRHRFRRRRRRHRRGWCSKLDCIRCRNTTSRGKGPDLCAFLVHWKRIPEGLRDPGPKYMGGFWKVVSQWAEMRF